MYDIAIVGAGPAGATLARLLSNQYRVLVLEKRELQDNGENAREKCCGGLIAPDAQRTLAALGLGLPREVIVGPQLFSVRTLDLDHQLERHYQRHYINIDRGRFDNWLISLIDDHTAIRDNCIVKTVRAVDGGVELDVYHESKPFTEKARIVIGADGANSNIRRSCGYRRQPPRYMALQEWYETDDAKPYYGGIFDSQITDFYSWTIPKEGQIILGTAVPYGTDPNRKFDALKKKMKAFEFNFGKRTLRHGSMLLRPMSGKHIHLGQQNLALVGEAAGWISPSSAEGISYAFRSAMALANALNDGLDGWLPRYRHSTASLRRNILVKSLKSLLLFNGLFRKLVMQTGLQAIRISQA